MKLLLLGEELTFLRTLSLELMVKGFAVRVENDTEGLRAALADSIPDVIVLDHVEPMDLFALNPRDWGYEGPILILVTDGLPQELRERMRHADVLKKPLDLETLTEEIRIVFHG